MVNTRESELKATLEVVTSTIAKCEKIQGKFAEGTSQHTLLRNRIKAMYISKLIIMNQLAKQSENLVIEQVTLHYTKDELIEAIRPVDSVINKCKKGQSKYEEGVPYYNRFEKIIRAMTISKELIEEEIIKS
ncbi:MAG: hypothetical protein ACRCW2_09020 [Cellulosilyticaceae bacterium]